MGDTRIYVYGLLHRSGFCEEVKGIYLSSDDTAHMRSNTENFCVGPFYRWESKINIWFVDRFSRRPFDIGQSKGLSLCQAAHVVDRLTILADFNSPNIFEERLANVIARANRSL